MPSLAIIERQTLHTEVMGAIASVARAKGYDAVSMYYNLGDPWHMVDYFARMRMPWIKEMGDWSVPFQKPVDAYDAIVLVTSDEWWRSRMLRRRVQEWMAAGKLLVVHHATCYLDQYVQFANYVGLTPAYGARYMFPLYEEPVHRPVVSAGGGTGLPTLVCVGSLDSKDRDDVGRYIEAGGKVANYVRYPADALMAKHGAESFACVSNLGGAELMAALKDRLADGAGFMWFPIDQASNYATTKFTGSLALGADFRAVLVMPRVLQKMMQLPDDAVIAYDTSVVEVLDKLQADPVHYVRGLVAWMKARWNANLQFLSAA